MPNERAISVLIVDDEPLARTGIRTMLAGQPAVGAVSEAASGRDAIDRILADRPDLVFLDVQMPRIDGFGVIEAIGAEAMPQVIFVTAYDTHAVRAFEVHAVDYLLKPVDPARFRDAFDRAVQLAMRKDEEPIRDVLARVALATRHARSTPNASTPQRLVVKQDGRIVFVDHRDVAWVEAAGNYVRVHAQGMVHQMRATLDEVEGRLGADFVRIRRSALVRTSAIRFCEPWGKGSWVFVLADGTRLTSSRYYRERLRALFGET
jgi:two-component system, LytTR family, response regulator